VPAERHTHDSSPTQPLTKWTHLRLDERFRPVSAVQPVLRGTTNRAGPAAANFPVMPQLADHAELLDELDPRTRKIVVQALAAHPDGRAPDRDEVVDLIDRTLGRITFEQYLRRARARRARAARMVQSAASVGT